MRDLFSQSQYYFGQIWSGLSIKAPISMITGLYTGYLGGDWLLFLIFCLMVGVDLFFGTWLSIKRQRFDPRLFGLWVVKVLTHFAVILIVALAAKSLLGPLNINFPLLDLFLGLLICTEALSILKNMSRLGLPVPKLATRILTNIQDQAERQTEEFFSHPNNDRRRTRRMDCDDSEQD